VQVDELSRPRDPGVDAARGLTARSDRKGLTQLALHLGSLSATSVLVALAWPSSWVFLAWTVHGCLLVFVFAPLHECTHRTAFRSRWLNDLVAHACGLVLLLPANYFRAFHLAHHAHTQDPLSDPELARAKPSTRASYLRHVSGIPYIVERVTTIARHACGKVDETFVSPACVSRVILEARLVIAFCAVLLGISWLLGSWAALVFWLIPLAFGQPMLRLFLLAEHTLCAQGAEVRYNTRTTCCHPLLRRLTWNMSFHLEHHLFPSIPFHALAAAHQRLAGSLPAPAPSYVSFHRSLIGTLK
jgi:fatty acid desaturase